MIEKQLSESREYMNRVKVISRCALSILMIVAGTMHFVDPEFFLKIMPPYLPLHKELVLISGAAGALAGLLYSGMMQTARYTFGTGAELAAIAAVILGGTSLFGGKATVIGTFVGALFRFHTPAANLFASARVG